MTGSLHQSGGKQRLKRKKCLICIYLNGLLADRLFGNKGWSLSKFLHACISNCLFKCVDCIARVHIGRCGCINVHLVCTYVILAKKY